MPKIFDMSQTPFAYPHMRPEKIAPNDKPPQTNFTGYKLPEKVAETSFKPGDDLGLRPTGSFVVIAPIEQKDTLDSGLALPQTANRKSNEGVIVAVGPGKREFNPAKAETHQEDTDGTMYVHSGWEYLPIDLSVGDRVLYIRWSGYKVEIENREFYVVDESNVVCVATNDTVELAFWQDKH